MNNQASSFHADRGARPWYRDRWPWLLIAGPAIAVVGSLASAWLAVASDDGVVANDYYKQGLLINRRLAATPTAADPGAMVVVGNDGRVRVRLTYNGAAPSRLQLTVLHPGEPAQVIALAPSDEGVWVGTMVPQTPGRWIVSLESNLWRLPVTTIQGRLSEISLGTGRAPS